MKDATEKYHLDGWMYSQRIFKGERGGKWEQASTDMKKKVHVLRKSDTKPENKTLGKSKNDCLVFGFEAIYPNEGLWAGVSGVNDLRNSS